MRHRINPTVDYAFKALLGAEENCDLLIHFLNGILKPEVPILDVQILNPFQDAEFDGDDYRVLDIKARDADERIHQIEIQLYVYPKLVSRLVYTLADLFQHQLSSGGDFQKLRPVCAIWVLDGVLLTDSAPWHHHFQLRDERTGRLLSDHLSLHTVELPKWTLPAGPLAPGDQWVYFLREARRWDALPASLNTPEMQKAMAVLDRISEKEADYFRYQARQNFLREQSTLRGLLAESEQAREAERQALEAERQALEAEHAARAQAEAQVEALRARLIAAGIDPDAP